MSKIRVMRAKDGQLPEGVTLAESVRLSSIKHAEWYCISPDLIAYGPYTSETAYWLMFQWLEHASKP